METDDDQKYLEACLRTFNRLACKIDEMNSKLMHIIEDLREVYLKNKYDVRDDLDSYWKYYEKQDDPGEDDEEELSYR